MYKNVFLRAGLTPTQSEILDFLYEKKESKASDIAKGIKKSRAIVYKDLDELVNFKIVERIDGANQVSIFRIEHPSNIEKFFESRENKLKKDKELFNNYLPDLISSYNLMSNKPGVRFYEGVKGVQKVFDDIISNAETETETEILAFAKVLENKKNQELNKILDSFVEKRVKKNLKSKQLVIDSEQARNIKFSDIENFRETRIINKEFMPTDFAGGEILVYKESIYLTAEQNNSLFSIIIQNKSISQLFTALFSSSWELSS